MGLNSPGDTALVVTALGLSAFLWFGWAINRPPWGWVVWLVLGMTASFTVTAGGAVEIVREWHEAVLLERGNAEVLGWAVVLGIALGAAGSALFALLGRSQFVAPWLALVFSAITFAFAGWSGYRVLYIEAALIVASVPASVAIARTYRLKQTSVTGAITGIVLLPAALGLFLSLPTT